jgi:hypothetical protein
MQLSTLENEPVRCDMTWQGCLSALNTLKNRERIAFSDVPEALRSDLKTYLTRNGIRVLETVSNFNFCQWYWHMVEHGVSYPVQFRVN